MYLYVYVVIKLMTSSKDEEVWIQSKDIVQTVSRCTYM